MGPEQLGYIIGTLLFVLLVPLAIYLVGHFMSRSKEPAARASMRKRFGLIAAITFVVLLAISLFANIDRFQKGSTIAQIRAGMERGCTNRCVQRTRQTAVCKRMCVCVTDRFIKNVGEARLKSMSSPKDMTSADRAKLVTAALQCRKQIKLKTQ